MVNGKKYIGQKCFDTNSMWKSYLGSGTAFKKALKKYGRENFSREIIAIVYSKMGLDLLEIEFIKSHNAVENREYYNVSYGGSTPQMSIARSRDVRLRIGKSAKGPSKETQAKINEWRKCHLNPMFNRHHTKEAIELIRQAGTGRHHTEESKIKMSAVQKARKHFKFNKETVNEIREKYATAKYSQTQLAEEYKCGTTTMWRIINNKRGYESIA